MMQLLSANGVVTGFLQTGCGKKLLGVQMAGLIPGERTGRMTSIVTVRNQIFATPLLLINILKERAPIWINGYVWQYMGMV
jgi:hypothetical protein